MTQADINRRLEAIREELGRPGLKPIRSIALISERDSLLRIVPENITARDAVNMSNGYAAEGRVPVRDAINGEVKKNSDMAVGRIALFSIIALAVSGA